MVFTTQKIALNTSIFRSILQSGHVFYTRRHTLREKCWIRASTIVTV